MAIVTQKQLHRHSALAFASAVKQLREIREIQKQLGAALPESLRGELLSQEQMAMYIQLAVMYMIKHDLLSRETIEQDWCENLSKKSVTALLTTLEAALAIDTEAQVKL